MSPSASEKTSDTSSKSLKLYLGVRAGRAIKRVVGPNTTLRILTGSLKGKKWIAGAGISQVLGLERERYTNRFEASILKSSIVYDIGAQVGWYTLLASDLVGPRGKVVAFEPLPSVLRYLKSNVEVNRCANVQIVEAAASDQDGIAEFFAKEDGSLGSLSPIYGPDKIMVKTVKIDSLVKNEIIPAPNFIKMDVERGEFAALKGAESTLVERAPMVFLETHGYDTCVDCHRLLSSFGYEVERFRGSGTLVALKHDPLARNPLRHAAGERTQTQ
jgi:FkbM family methyltransferase